MPCSTHSTHPPCNLHPAAAAPARAGAAAGTFLQTHCSDIIWRLLRLPRLPFFTNTSLVIFLPKSCYLTFILKKGTKNTYYVHFNRAERKYNSTYFWLQNSDFLANHKILPLQSGPWRGVY